MGRGCGLGEADCADASEVEGGEEVEEVVGVVGGAESWIGRPVCLEWLDAIASATPAKM